MPLVLTYAHNPVLPCPSLCTTIKSTGTRQYASHVELTSTKTILTMTKPPSTPSASCFLSSSPDFALCECPDGEGLSFRDPKLCVLYDFGSTSVGRAPCAMCSGRSIPDDSRTVCILDDLVPSLRENVMPANVPHLAH